MVNLPISFGFVPRLAIVGRAVHKSERQKAVHLATQRRARGCQLPITRSVTACGCELPFGDALAIDLEDAE